MTLDILLASFESKFQSDWSSTCWYSQKSTQRKRSFKAWKCNYWRC